MKTDNIQKKVGDFMGGKILDLPEFRIYDQAKAEGRAEGEAERRALEEERDALAEERDTLVEEIAQLRKALEEATKGN